MGEIIFEGAFQIFNPPLFTSEISLTHFYQGAKIFGKFSFLKINECFLINYFKFSTHCDLEQNKRLPQKMKEFWQEKLG